MGADNDNEFCGFSFEGEKGAIFVQRSVDSGDERDLTVLPHKMFVSPLTVQVFFGHFVRCLLPAGVQPLGNEPMGYGITRPITEL